MLPAAPDCIPQLGAIIGRSGDHSSGIRRLGRPSSGVLILRPIGHPTQLADWIPPSGRGRGRRPPAHAAGAPLVTPRGVDILAGVYVPAREVVVAELNAARRADLIGRRPITPRWFLQSVITASGTGVPHDPIFISVAGGHGADNGSTLRRSRLLRAARGKASYMREAPINQGQLVIERRSVDSGHQHRDRA